MKQVIFAIALLAMASLTGCLNADDPSVDENTDTTSDTNPLYAEPRYSHLGIIDTGDLVIVKEAEKSDIVTYLAGKKTGYKMYGDYGDVIVYYKNGIDTYNGQPVTPVDQVVIKQKDVVTAVGIAKMTPEEMISMNRGIAVEVRHHA